MPEPIPDRPRLNPRVDLGQRLRRELREADAPETATAVRAAPRHRIIGEPTFWVAAVSLPFEPWPGAEAESLGLARRLAGDAGGVVLIRLGARAGARDAGALGADRLVQTTDTSLAALSTSLSAFPARHILFAEGFADGDLARRLAVRMGERPAAGVLAIESGRVILRGDGGCSDLSRALPRLLVLARNRFDPWEGLPGEGRGIAAPDPVITDAPDDLPLIETITLPAVDVPLAQADFILSAGEGVTDWPVFHHLAAVLGAAEGGSRQVCDAGHLPRARQVGASGTLVEARAYLAFGISGAPQHLQGVQRCRLIVAVNTDLHAAMVKRADLAIIADAQEVMPALARLMGDKA
ncbi:MAG: electron transfer flavoprotein subunit alpha/FixB family protein [Gemmobacter sp.]|nr:electron transfer flavoprotein subunit alpha/FixB family protein [Gemmobacter sp.]